MQEYRVVVVDDEILIREFITKYINKEIEGFTSVACFDDGQEAIDYINTNPVDVVITDVKMLKVSGLEIAKYIHENKLNIEVIIISAYRHFEYAQEALEYRTKSYLLKPIDPDDLERTLEKIKKELDQKNSNVPEQQSNSTKEKNDGIDVQQSDVVMQKALSYIRENYMRQISLREVADRVYLNEFYFSKLFKKKMNKSFTEYLVELRMEKAIELLKSGKYKLYEISSLVGYESNYFIKVFKNYTGYRPNEYCLRVEDKDE